MIDLNLFAKILANDNSGYIEPGDVLTEEAVSLLSDPQWKISKVISLFKKHCWEGKELSVAVICPICGQIEMRPLTKSQTLKYLNFIRKQRTGSIPQDEIDKWCCTKCAAQRQKARKKIEQKRKQSVLLAKAKATKEFINYFLDPKKKWAIEPCKWWITLVNHYVLADEHIIAKYIRQMPYSEFLKTPYWLAVAQRVKYDAKFRCQVCGSKENLNCHHRSYEYLGYEITHRSELICLCQNCHQLFHDATQKNKEGAKG